MEAKEFFVIKRETKNSVEYRIIESLDDNKVGYSIEANTYAYNKTEAMAFLKEKLQNAINRI